MSKEPEAGSVIRRTPQSLSADQAAVDPMADIASIVDDAMVAGLDPRQLAFACVYMRFAQRSAWETAALQVDPSWEVAAYSTAQGHMLRLSRTAHPTSRDLAKLRADALTFANAHAADWLSMSIEDAQRAPTAWAGIRTREEIRLPEQRTSPDDDIVDDETQVHQLRRGGTA